MQIKITYKVKSGEVRSRSFIKLSVREALKFFEWRYGHEVIKHEVIA
jgi:hypothetical protein